MIEFFIFVLLYIIVKWGLIIFAGIFVLSLIVRFFRYITNVSSTTSKAKQAEKTYGKDSVGAMLARNEADAARGDYDALLNTSADRSDIKAIIDWFNDVVTKGKYSAIHETEAGPGEPNYAFVMDNNSGFDFREFSCRISVKDGDALLGNVVGTAKNWKNNTEGKIWFYCVGKVNKATIDVRSLKYVLDIDPEEDKKRRDQKRVEAIIGNNSYDVIDYELDELDSDDITDDAIDFDTEIENENIYEPYICPVCFEPYDGIYCENCGHSNDEPGYEEVSDDEKWVENMVAMALFDAEDRRREEKNNSFFDDEFDEDDIY